MDRITFEAAPSERRVLKWPQDVEAMTGIGVQTLTERRAAGDCPRLYAIGRRILTTTDDVIAWLEAHTLEAGGLVRAPTVPRGSKRDKKTHRPIGAEAA